ncbi:FKBP type peptidyl prolyl cis trans [Trichuris trichiura]|uniref:peptidylprolyl isomerase n=1 Tax=Trichuris trichiura TaxID=36087 RepID=A0A077Z4M8_TRITR|nr:FKBP type peptidyl prolyl cis trans [Trichuris trichiura]
MRKDVTFEGVLLILSILPSLADIGPSYGSNGQAKVGEDALPIIEIRAEGKPMTSAQIRALEEEAEGKPLDIKVKYERRRKDCARRAKRKDFITFHYEGHLEDGLLFDSSYNTKSPIRIQLKVGLIIPGLDKALGNVCKNDILRVDVPWRLAQRKRSTKWRRFPKDEHWITFEVNVLNVEPWTSKLQFKEMDNNADGYLTLEDIEATLAKEKNEYGKAYTGFGIDPHEMALYFVRYFDSDNDEKVSLSEYERKIAADIRLMEERRKSRVSGRQRDPSVGWILDFNGDGFVDYNELTAAKEIFHGGFNASKSESFLKEEL